jgi:hypothetical protein
LFTYGAVVLPGRLFVAGTASIQCGLAKVNEMKLTVVSAVAVGKRLKRGCYSSTEVQLPQLPSSSPLIEQKGEKEKTEEMHCSKDLKPPAPLHNHFLWIN